MVLKPPQVLQLAPGQSLGLDSVRTRLAALWLGGSALVLVILVLQSLLGRYGEKVQDVWGWALPTLMPTLGMTVAGLGYTALDPTMSETVVRRSFFNVAFWLSALYLALILLTVLIQPFVGADSQQALQMMRVSNLWLGPIQGLVASALGVLFVSKRKQGE